MFLNAIVTVITCGVYLRVTFISLNIALRGSVYSSKLIINSY